MSWHRDWLEEPWLGNVEGFFDDRRIERLPRECRSRLLGRFRDLPEYARLNQIHVIYVCLPISKHPRIRALARRAARYDGFDLLRARTCSRST